VPPLLAEWLQALAATAPADFFRDSTSAYTALNAAHIFSIGLVVGSIVTLDLRLLGLFRGVPLEGIAVPLTRVAAAGLLLAIMTGFVLFSVRPVAYAQNPAFLAKVALVALGAGNVLLLHMGRAWTEAMAGGEIADSVRAAALRSILIWMAAVLAGRWIGFLQ